MRLGRTPFLRRLWLGVGLVLAFALTGCGSSGVKFNEFLPKRIIIIGDEITYVGCNTATSNGQTVCAGADKFDRFSINSISGSSALVNNWVVRLALNYGLTTDKIIEPTVAGNDVRAAKLGARATPPAPPAATPSWKSVSEQASLIPSYVTGDMVVVAGGANDVLAVLKDPSIGLNSGTFKRGLTVALANEILTKLGTSAITQAQAYYIIAAAQSYQDIALDLIRTKGQQNVFMAPVYDFSNSPDLSQFCSGCTVNQVKQGIALFNYILRLLTDDSFEPMVFTSGNPRILVSSGTSGYDLFYVNLPYFTTVLGSAVYNYDTTHSVCGASSTLTTPPTDLTGCTWNGLYATNDGVNPIFNGTTYASAPYPDYITNQGKYIYAQNQYLTPVLHVIVGNTIAIFMRGYNGW